MTTRHQVTISYCPACHWLPRSAWMAQELLHTFANQLAEVALRPAATPGEFVVAVNGCVIWDRGRDGGFPDIAQLKRKVRDVIDPDHHLGHLDRSQES